MIPSAHTAPATDRPVDRPVDRLRWAMADTRTIVLRTFLHARNKPGVTVFGWLFPVGMMAMFLGLFGGTMSAVLGQAYIDFMMPGILVMAVFFGFDTTLAAVSSDAAKGVTDRFRSLPMSSVAVVAGRSVADLIDATVSLLVVSAAGVLFGWRPDITASSAIAALGLLLLLRFSLVWISIFIGLKIKDPEATTAVQLAVWPLLFLSGIFIDTSTMPRWLGLLAEANPLTATTIAVRDLFGITAVPGQSWLIDNASPLSLAWPILLTVVFLPLATHAYRRLRR